MKVWKKKKYYRIYYIHDPETGEIIYVGRTGRNPEVRFQEHMKENRIPQNSVLGLFFQRFYYAKDSKNAETRAIRKHKPKFNRSITHKIH